jgi:signal transduction histidine kinase
MGFKRSLSSQRQYDVTHPGTPTACHAFDAGVNQRLAERTRIAQDLHDTLLQGFFAVSMQLHTAVSELPADFAARNRFSGILDRMDRVIEDGRRAVQGLRSPQEDGASLGHALAGVPSDLCHTSAAEFKVVVVGTPRELRPEVSDELYFIGREAIVNAYRVISWRGLARE